jgi:multisubunit Na+/H+ antiporter MnhC subunit
LAVIKFVLADTAVALVLLVIARVTKAAVVLSPERIAQFLVNEVYPVPPCGTGKVPNAAAPS